MHYLWFLFILWRAHFKGSFKNIQQEDSYHNLQLLSPAIRSIMIANPSADYTNQKMVSSRPLCQVEFYFLHFSDKQRQVCSAYGMQDTRWRKGQKLFFLHLSLLRVILSMPASCLPEQMQKIVSFLQAKSSLSTNYN